MMKGIILALTASLSFITTSAVNAAGSHIGKANMKGCAKEAKAYTDYFFEDRAGGEHSVWDGAESDSSFFTTTIERTFYDGTGYIANVTVVPRASGECYIELQQVSAEDASCEQVAKGLARAKSKDILYKRVMVLDKTSYLRGGTATVYLMPDGDQCTMVQKTVITRKVEQALSIRERQLPPHDY